MVKRKFVGPVRPGTSEKAFRETGREVRLRQGPVRPGTDVEEFRSGRGTGLGGGSSGSSGPSPEQIKEKQEAEIKAAEEKARQELLEKQREQAEATKQRIAQEKAQVEKLKKLSAQQKKQFFIEQSQISKAARLEKLQQKGARLTPKAKQLLADVKKREGEKQFRQIVKEGIRQPESTFLQTTKKGVVDIRTGELQREKGKVNIFSVKAWRDLGNALRKSKSKEDRELGKKILTEPLLFVSKFVPRVAELKDIPTGLLALAKDPRNIKQVPGNIAADFKDTAQLIRTSPSEGFAKIGADIFTFKLIGNSFRFTGQVSSNVATRLSPKFVGVAKTGAKLKIRGTGPNKIVNLDVVKSIPKQSLKKQIKIEGKKIDAISSQADSLLGLINKEKVIRKPIPNENLLPKKTKDLLKKFDEGKIKKKELIQLDNLIKKKGEKGLLERSFFADPTGKIRPSRLGVLGEKEASLKDLVTGQAALKKSKPQILLFEDINIQRIPKALSSIKKKLSNNQPLNKLETEALLKWQQQKTGKFKPLGFVSRESEITLAPGEIIKKVKTVGVTLVNGKRVPIISVKVIQPTKITKDLLKKAKLGKATEKELKQLSKKLKKETGFKQTTSSLKKTKRFFPLKRKLVSRVVSRVSKKKRVRVSRLSRPSRLSKPSKPVSRPSPKKPSKPSKPKPSKPVSRPSPKKPSKTSKPISRPPKIPTKPPKGPPKKIIKVGKKKKKVTKKRKSQQAYNVKARPIKKFKKQKQPKLVKVNRRPLGKRDAKNLRNYIADTSLARTSKIQKTKGKPKKPIIKVPKNYAKNTKKKFRPYRVVKGKKKPLRKGTVIERKTQLLDTKQERKGITLRKRISQITPTTKPKRTLSNKQLSNLAKGREKLKQMRKKK